MPWLSTVGVFFLAQWSAWFAEVNSYPRPGLILSRPDDLSLSMSCAHAYLISETTPDGLRMMLKSSVIPKDRCA